MTETDVLGFVEQIPNERRRRDALTLIELMERATGEKARLWGTIIAFGTYHYEYASGRSGDAPAAGFSPRSQASTVYLAEGVGEYPEELGRLGPHTTGKVCVYIKDLAAIDLAVLEEMVTRSYRTVTAETFGKRAVGAADGEQKTP